MVELCINSLLKSPLSGNGICCFLVLDAEPQSSGHIGSALEINLL